MFFSTPDPSPPLTHPIETSRHSVRPSLSAVLATLILMSATIYLWNRMDRDEDKRIQEKCGLAADALAEQLNQDLTAVIHILDRMARRWKNGAYVDRVTWLVDAEANVEDFPGLIAMEWADNDGYVRWVVPLAGNEHVVDLHLEDEPHRAAALEQANETHHTAISNLVDLLHGEQGSLALKPLHRGGKEEGFLLGIFEFKNWFENRLEDVFGEFHFEIYDGQTSILIQGQPMPESKKNYLAQSAIDSAAATWEVHLWPSDQFIYDRETELDEVILVMGLFMSLGIGSLLHLTHVLRAKETAALHLLDKLERAGENLTRVNEQLSQKNQEMEQFIYTASHDLKSPLVTILGYAGHITNGVAQGKLDELPALVGRITSAADRMKKNIDDLLELSRIGRMMGEPEQIDVNGLLAELCDSLAQRLADKQATMEIDADLPAIFADHRRVWEAFENLLTNAIKYGCNGRATAKIRVGGELRGDQACFFVQDSGPGVPQEHQDKVFGLFQRLSRDRKEEGTGVGLTIVRRIAKMHGGRAWVESVSDAGARFWISFRSQDMLAAGVSKPSALPTQPTSKP